MILRDPVHGLVSFETEEEALAAAEALYGMPVRVVADAGEATRTVATTAAMPHRCHSLHRPSAEPAPSLPTTAPGALVRLNPIAGTTSPLPLDAEIYKWRHLIENFFLQAQAAPRHRHAL